MKNRFFIILILASFLIPNKLKKTSLNNEQRKIINQANSLRKNGLIEESSNVYHNLFNNFPNLYEAYKPLKSILIKQKDWEKLTIVSEQFLIANNQSIKSQVEVLEVYLLTNDVMKWKGILSNLKKNFPKK